MASSSCTSCDQSKNLGIFEGIRLTLVCSSCASIALSDEGDPIVCFSSARALFPTIPPKRVKDLGSTPRRNPHYRNAAPMHMYSVGELRVLQNTVDQEMKVKATQVEIKRQTRLGRMVSVYNISPAAPLHCALFSHIFGDYLSAANPKKKLGELKYRFSAHDTAVRLCALDPVAAMYFLERRRVTTPRFSQNLLREFEHSIFVAARAFRLEGLAISRYLSPAQLDELRGGPLSQIPDSVDRLKKNAPKMLRMSLLNLGFGGAVVQKMMKFPAMRTRVRRCVEYAHDTETVSAKMAEFWKTKDDRTHRRQILQDAMHAKDLSIRDDSVYCHDYICGLIDVDLAEIVGVQYITRELFDMGGSRFWSEYHDTCENIYRHALLENGNTMDQSIKIALRKCASRKRRRFY